MASAGAYAVIVSTSFVWGIAGIIGLWIVSGVPFQLAMLAVAIVLRGENWRQCSINYGCPWDRLAFF